MKSYDPKHSDKQILGLCLDVDFYDKVKNTIERSMFDRELRDVFDSISYSHDKYGKTLTVAELCSIFNDRNPALPDSSRKRTTEIILNLERGNPENEELHLDLVNNFWLRDRARQIGEKAIEIFTGESDEFGELKRLIEAVDDGRITDKTSYTIVDDDLDALLDELEGDPDFPFEFDLIAENVAGLSRGDLGIIFARPEVGKTTFCSFLASSYIRQKFKVVYFANEEKAEKIKLRIIRSFFGVTKEEMKNRRPELVARYMVEIAPYFTMMDAINTNIEEVNEYCKLNKPDILFCDQLDKFRINGEYLRGDERLKETYVLAREIAKRNKMLVWAVSQASNDGHDRQWVDYNMMDNSKTGKAGEADIIIGIAKTGRSDVTNVVRHICISKNKINGWHGMINANIDIGRGTYY